MKVVKCLPGRTYYLMALLALAFLSWGAGTVAGIWSHDDRFGGLIICALGFVGICTVVLGWHAFTVTEAGLHVRDIRGSRVHRWTDLRLPYRRRFGGGGGDYGTLGGRGPIVADSYSHLICNPHGRTLYRIGPWYPLRYKLLSEVRRRIRETQPATPP